MVGQRTSASLVFNEDDVGSVICILVKSYIHIYDYVQCSTLTCAFCGCIDAHFVNCFHFECRGAMQARVDARSITMGIQRAHIVRLRIHVDVGISYTNEIATIRKINVNRGLVFTLCHSFHTVCFYIRVRH